MIYLLFRLSWFFAVAQAFSLAVASEGCSLCSAWASHCGGFSCCGAQAPKHTGFSSCDVWAR